MRVSRPLSLYRIGGVRRTGITPSGLVRNRTDDGKQIGIHLDSTKLSCTIHHLVMPLGGFVSYTLTV